MAVNIDFFGKPELPLVTLLERYHGIFLIMDDVLATKASFKKIFQEILDILKYGFEVAPIRHKKIYFKFHEDDEVTHSLRYMHFLSNMILWEWTIEEEDTSFMDESFIHDFNRTTIGEMADYIDDIILSNCKNLSFHQKSAVVDEIWYKVVCFSNAFGRLLGLGISCHSIMQIEEQFPEVSEIMYGKIPENLQPSEVEEELKRRTNVMIKYFSENPNDLQPMFLSGKNLTPAQFKEIIVSIGLISDLNGDTIPYIINTNILVGGISKPSYFFLKAKSARKSLVLSKTKMGDPGALSKKMANASTASVLSKYNDPCDTKRLICYEIKTEDHLRCMDGRYYVEGDQIKLLDYKKDKHLIGQMRYFYDPITCSCKEDGGICSRCYGELFKMNQDLFSAGNFAATKISEPAGQSVLSTKHSQVTTSDIISFTGDFRKYFQLSTNEIMIDDNVEEELFIQFDEVEVEDGGDVEYYFCDHFTVLDSKFKAKYVCKEDNGCKIHLSPQMIKLYKKSNGKPIPLYDFDDDSEALFTVEVKSAQSTAIFDMLRKSLSSKNHMGATTIDEFAQAFLDNLIAGGIKYNGVHASMILRQMVRKKSNILEYPCFDGSGDPNDYQLITIDNSLIKNPSPILSMASGDLRRQLISPILYEKNATSHLDPMFLTHVDDSRDETISSEGQFNYSIHERDENTNSNWGVQIGVSE